MSGSRFLASLVLSNLFFCSVAPTEAQAATPWPGETWQQAENLTGLSSAFTNNLSGAHWNPNTRTLWVCLNGPGKFWALTEDGNGSFEIDGEWYPGGDLEAITQVDLDDPSVYVMVEGQDKIRRYDVTDQGVVSLMTEWNIGAYVPTSGGAGSEGITFVPDAWLVANGFVDRHGDPYASQNGMGGLMFVAHQNGGRVYAFDLDPDSGGYDFVGGYVTSRGESSGLEFDRSSGTLYVWHNTGGNFIELTDLSSFVRPDGQRQFVSSEEYNGPKGGNLEGIAVTPVSSGDDAIFITDDNNQNGAALMWFREFVPDIELPTAATQVRVSASNDDAEERADGSMYLRSSDLELTQERTTQTVGVRFASLDVPEDAIITWADIQFTVDEATSGGTNLTIFGEDSGDPASYSSAQQNISSRTKTASSVHWAPEPWSVVGESNETERTPDLTSIVQEMVTHPDWTTGDPVAFVLTGNGKRVAESYNGSPAAAPLLFVEYVRPGPPEPESPIVSVDVRVSSPNDDAEERPNGSMYLTSTDLELSEDRSTQTVGIRFAALDIPVDASITKAYVQFTVDETSSGDADLTISGEDSANPASFSGLAWDISSRTTTANAISWAPEPWVVVGESGETQRTPDLTSIVQEMVTHPDWTAGNPVAFVLTGSGKRVAESYNGTPASAPVLHVEYER
jgi:hypothetical protein